jgi:hypothetical protein
VKWYRTSPLFVAALAAAGLVVLGDAVCIGERWVAVSGRAARLRQKQAELAGMRDVTPPPTRAVAAAIESDLAQAERLLAEMRGRLAGHGAAAERIAQAKPPAAGTDAYFDLAGFVERTRDLARKNDVEVRADAAYFGFSTYAHEGPDAEHIAAVFRQRQIVEHLVGLLVEARPRALLAVQRERPLSAAERAAPVAAGEPADAAAAAPVILPADGTGDLFALDPGARVGTPGFLESTAFRIKFVGQTATLRAFLNRLAGFELPLIVREIEAEPVPGESGEPFAAAESRDPAAKNPLPSIVLSLEDPAANSARGRPMRNVARSAPIVARPWTAFTVTIEYVELAAAPAARAAPDAPKPAT